MSTAGRAWFEKRSLSTAEASTSLTTRHTGWIINTTDTHAALNLYIDGRKANLTPILIYRNGARRINGFDLTRNSLELENNEFETTGTYARFVATRQPDSGPGTTDDRIGIVKCVFYATEYVRRQPGRAQQLTALNDTHSTQHNARRGVMATGSGSVTEKRGKHFNGEETSGRRPVATKNLLDPSIQSYEITICELQGLLTLGSNSPNCLTNEFSELGGSTPPWPVLPLQPLTPSQRRRRRRHRATAR